MISHLKTQIFKESPILYTGRELSPHWIFKHFDLHGDSLVAFLGPADVPVEHMVDLEDVKKKAPIASSLMLHFLAEWFLDSLDQAILLQHLFVREIYELLLEKKINKLTRSGDDIYYDSRKLSVSIATRTAVSTLMHTALNVRTDGTPVPTSGLSELGIEPFPFAEEVIGRFVQELSIWRNARTKVLPR